MCVCVCAYITSFSNFIECIAFSRCRLLIHCSVGERDGLDAGVVLGVRRMTDIVAVVVVAEVVVQVLVLVVVVVHDDVGGASVMLEGVTASLAGVQIPGPAAAAAAVPLTGGSEMLEAAVAAAAEAPLRGASEMIGAVDVVPLTGDVVLVDSFRSRCCSHFLKN